MNAPFIVDAHVHTGYPAVFFSPEVDSAALLRRMDQFDIQYAVNLGSMRNLLGITVKEMEKSQKEYEESEGRLFYCGFFDPRRGMEDITVLEKAAGLRGFKGIKIHPSFNRVPAEDERYDTVWRFAEEHDLPIVAHSWSVSSYNPVQALSSPGRFEPFASKYSGVRFVLAHSGGRGEGRGEAVRMAKKYENVFMDLSGDIYCFNYFENMVKENIMDKILFGSDYPWVDLRSHLTRVYLSDLPTIEKQKVLRETALKVFKLG